MTSARACSTTGRTVPDTPESGGQFARRGRQRAERAIAAAPRAAASVVLGAVLILVLSACSTSSSSGSQATPTPATVAADRLDSLLLTAPEVGTIMGATDMQPRGPIAHAAGHAAFTLSNPDCLGVLYAALLPTYQGSGYSAISSILIGEVGKNLVSEAVVSFTSADQALNFVKSSTPIWKACAGQTVTASTSDSTSGQPDPMFAIGSVVGDAPKISLINTQTNGQLGWACQRTLRAESNLVIDIKACKSPGITDQANEIADTIASKMH